MKPSTQRYLIVFVSLALTAFLAGGFSVGWKLIKDYNLKLSDSEFLTKQLTRIREAEGGDSSANKGRVKTVRTSKAVREKLGATRFFSGRLVEIHRSILAAETTGPIIVMPVEVGMSVKEGQTLVADVDTIWTKLAADQARRQIEVSRVQLKFNEREYDRLKNLSDQGPGYVSASDLDSQKLKIEELQANISLQEVVLTEAEKKVARSRILAPYDGVIVRKLSEVGAFVSPGSPLVEIVSSGKIDAELQVSESFIDRLKVGDKVPIWIDSLNQETLGTIFSIVPYGSTAARSFPVRIRLDDQNGRLKVGMSVRGRLQITDAKDSIVVEKDAVLDRPDGALIWVISNERNKQGKEIPNRKIAQPLQVVITARTDTKYAVVPLSLEGKNSLQPGVDCVIEGADRLMVNEHVMVATVDPELMKNLPKASGHSIIAPVEDTPFFDMPQSGENVKNKNGASSNQPGPAVTSTSSTETDKATSSANAKPGEIKPIAPSGQKASNNQSTDTKQDAAIATSQRNVPVSDSTSPQTKDLRGKNE